MRVEFRMNRPPATARAAMNAFLSMMRNPFPPAKMADVATSLPGGPTPRLKGYSPGVGRDLGKMAPVHFRPLLTQRANQCNWHPVSAAGRSRAPRLHGGGGALVPNSFSHACLRR